MLTQQDQILKFGRAYDQYGGVPKLESPRYVWPRLLGLKANPVQVFCGRKFGKEAKELGFDPWNGNPNYASLRLPGTGKREGREYTKPFQQLTSRPFIVLLMSQHTSERRD